jgi:hypothetical protein
MRTSQGAFDVPGRTAQYRMLTDREKAQFRRDIAPGGYYDRLHGLHGPGGAFDARPDHQTPEFASERDVGQLASRDRDPADYHRPLIDFLEEVLEPDVFQRALSLLENEEEEESEDGDYDTPDQEEDWEEQYPARDEEGRVRNFTGREDTVADEPPPFPGRPRPGGTMDRCTPDGRPRGRAMDTAPPPPFMGYESEYDRQRQRDAARRAERLYVAHRALEVAASPRVRARIATDAARRIAAQRVGRQRAMAHDAVASARSVGVHVPFTAAYGLATDSRATRRTSFLAAFPDAARINVEN